MNDSTGNDDATPEAHGLRQPRGLIPVRVKRRWPLWRKVVLGVVGVFVLLVLAGFLIAPPIAKAQLEKHLTQLTHRETHVGKVRINPLTLSCAIEGLRVGDEAAGGEPLAQWKRFYASLDLRTFFSREWRFREIALDGFNGRIAVDKNGRLNFADLFASTDSPQHHASPNGNTASVAQGEDSTDVAPVNPAPLDTAELPPSFERSPAVASKQGNSSSLHINRLTVTDAHIEYSDDALPQRFATEIGPMSFTVTDFQTGGPDRAPGTFSATTSSGESFTWKGVLAVSPLYSEGVIRLGNLPLKKYTPYFGHFVRFAVLDGSLDVEVPYKVLQDHNGLSVQASQGGVTLHGLQLAEVGGTVPVVSLETLSMIGIDVHSGILQGDVRSQELSIERLLLQNGSISVKRDAHGFNVAELFMPADQPASPGKTPAGPAVAETGQPAPRVRLGELSLQNFTVAYEDSTTPQPVKLAFDHVNLTFKKFASNELAETSAINLSANVATNQGVSGETGTLKADGVLAAHPFRSEIHVDWSDLPLSVASAYLELVANVRVAKGEFSGKGTANLMAVDTTEGQHRMAVIADGDLQIKDLSVADALSGVELQSWKLLDLKDISYRTGTVSSGDGIKLSLREIALDGASTHIVMQPDGSINLGRLARQAPEQPGANQQTPAVEPKTVEAATAPISITIGRVMLSNGRAIYSDQSVKPEVKMSLDDIGGEITGLSSDNLAHANVDLSAKVNGSAPISLVGQINPLADDKFTDLKLSGNGIGLMPLGSYVSKYAGRSLAGGTLTVDVKTHLSKRVLDSSNVITLEQFQFGERVESPDATSLPLGLAVALLRDSKGRIVLDVPIQGSLDDPNFRYGRAVWRAVGNLVVKAATAPFSLLGAMFGANGGSPQDQDLSYAEFEAGTGEPGEEGRRKLDIIARALRERPELKLSLSGGFDGGVDPAALRRLELARAIRREYLEELGQPQGGDGGTPQGEASATEIAPDMEARLVGVLYRRAFGFEMRTLENAPAGGGRVVAVGAGKPSGGVPISPNVSTASPGSNRARRVVVIPVESKVAAEKPAAVASSGTSVVSINLDAAPADAASLPPVEEMRSKLQENIPVAEPELKKLAAVRAEAVRNYLITQGQVPADRVLVSNDQTANGALVSLQLQ